MTFISNLIKLNYSDEKLSILVEEYIARQKKEFTFKGVCAYILYWAMEDEMAARGTLYATNELQQADLDRISRILEKIVKDGRISKVSVENNRFVKQ